MKQRLTIRIAEPHFIGLHGHLFQNRNEQHAFLFGRLCSCASELRILIRDMVFAEEKDIIRQTPTFIELAPQYCADAIERCRREDLHLIDVHSHPFCSDGVAFSGIDWACADRREEWHRRELPEMLSISLVFGFTSFQGIISRHGRDRIGVDRIEIIGTTDACFGSVGKVLGFDARYDRQVRAFGAQAQQRLAKTQVGIVGLGGLGSVLAPVLAHSGVVDFVLVDADCVETSNLNRLVGATEFDAKQGTAKVDVVERCIRAIQPQASVRKVQDRVETRRAREALKSADFLFSGVDNNGARLIVAELAFRYLLPLIDMGTGISITPRFEAGGQIAAWLPGSTCPLCTGFLKLDTVGIDLAMPELREARALNYGIPEPAPAVMSLNATVAATAATEFLLWAAGKGLTPGIVTYSADRRTMEAVSVPPLRAECPLCGVHGRLALGDETECFAPLPARPRREHVSP